MEFLNSLPILNIFVLHVGQVPFTAGLPFLRVVGVAPWISLLLRHFTQYPIVMFRIEDM